jgi:hypothetical protein
MSLQKRLSVGLLLLVVGVTAAQDACPAVVQEALSSLDTNCELTERNQACYGNIDLTAIPQSNVQAFEFDSVGDIANLADINTLDLQPMDAAAGKWGLVMMRVQADIPNTLPGQNVTFVLFGDVTIQNAAKEGQTPMQAFYLTTGIGDANCAEAPESGLMVQTPAGVKEVAFNINGVDVEMGSTVIFQAKPGNQMRVKTIEGKARLKVGKKTIPVVQGSEYVTAINEQSQVVDETQGDVIPYETHEVESLPVQSLERPIAVSKPLTQAQIEEVEQKEEAGEVLCSDEPDTYLPPCTTPLIDAHGEEVHQDENGNVILTDDAGEPLLYDQEGEPITSMDDYYRYYSYWTDTQVLTDDFGNTIEVTDDGTVSIRDVEGNVLIATPEGTYTYTDTEGETHTFDGQTEGNELIFDAEGNPVIRDEAGAITTIEPTQPADESDPRPESTDANATPPAGQTDPSYAPTPEGHAPIEESPPPDTSSDEQGGDQTQSDDGSIDTDPGQDTSGDNSGGDDGGGESGGDDGGGESGGNDGGGESGGDGGNGG